MATNNIQIPNQAPGTTVIIMNQNGRNTGPQYIRRGTTCCGGYHVSTCSYICILFWGIMFSVMSFAYIPFTKLTLLALPVGIFFIGLYIHLLRKAKREFDALPADHPDRLKFSGYNITQLPVNLNPPSNQAAAPPNSEPQVPPHPEGQKYLFPESSFPQNPNYPGQGLSAPPQGPYPPPQGPYPPPQGYTSTQGPSAPYPPPQRYTSTQGPSAPYPPPQGYSPAKCDDDPPPYSAL